MLNKIEQKQPRHYFHGVVRELDGFVYNGAEYLFQTLDVFKNSVEPSPPNRLNHQQRLASEKLSAKHFGLERGFFVPTMRKI